MKSIFTLYSLMLWSMISILLASCSTSPTESVDVAKTEQEQTSARVKVVGISLPTDESSRWLRDGEILERRLFEAGFGVKLLYAENKAKTQEEQIQNLLIEGVNILVISPVDGASLSDLLKAAHESGVLVIAYDSLIKSTPDVDFFATFNFFDAGVMQASQIVQALGLEDGKGPFNIELFAGSPFDPKAQSFYKGSLSILQPYIEERRLIVLSDQESFEEVSILNWDDVTARVRMMELLDSFYRYDRVDAILSPSDSISQGILDALKKAGYGSSSLFMPVITGQGAEAEAIKSIIAGDQTFTILFDDRNLAEQTANMVIAALQGKSVPVNNTTTYDNNVKIVPTYELFPVSIDINNYDELIIQSDFLTADQVK